MPRTACTGQQIALVLLIDGVDRLEHRPVNHRQILGHHRRRAGLDQQSRYVGLMAKWYAESYSSIVALKLVTASPNRTIRSVVKLRPKGSETVNLKRVIGSNNCIGTLKVARARQFRYESPSPVVHPVARL